MAQLFASNQKSVRTLEGDTLRLFISSRMLAIELAPYLAIALFRLQPLAAPGLGSVAVDRWWRIYIDPSAFASWSLSERALSLLHEVSHLIRDHAGRCDDLAADHRIFNIAGDAEINDDLDRFEPAPGRNIQYEGVPDDWIVPGRLTPAAEENLLAEVYYRHLVENEAAPQEKVSCPDCTGTAYNGGTKSDIDKSTENPTSAKKQTASGQAGDTDRGYSSTISRQQHGYWDGTCGSGAGGGRRSWELAPNDDALAPGVNEATADLVRRQVAHATVGYAKTRGTVPGGILRWAEGELLETKTPWRRILSGAIKRAIAHTAGQVDYSYRRPGRRRVPHVIMPAMRRPIPLIAVVVDTSGSMSADDIHLCLSEIKRISSQVGIRGQHLRLLQVDADVLSIETVFDIHRIEIRGGGGTDMIVGIRAAEKLRPRPNTIIVLTDGETPWPSVPSGIRLIIGIIGTEETIAKGMQKVPSWADVIGIISAPLDTRNLSIAAPGAY